MDKKINSNVLDALVKGIEDIREYISELTFDVGADPRQAETVQESLTRVSELLGYDKVGESNKFEIDDSRYLMYKAVSNGESQGLFVAKAFGRPTFNMDIENTKKYMKETGSRFAILSNATSITIIVDNDKPVNIPLVRYNCANNTRVETLAKCLSASKN